MELSGPEEVRLEQLAATELSGGDVAHGLDHLRAVAGNVHWLLQDSSASAVDERVVLAAAWLHDIRSRTQAGFADAALSSARVAEGMLERLGYSADERARTAACIETASWEHHLEGGVPNSPEAKILRDADWLEAMGAVGIARVFAFAGTHKVPLAFVAGDPTDPVRLPASSDGPDPSPFHHFYSKLLWLRDGLLTPRAREEGERRHRLLVCFLQDYRDELRRTGRTTVVTR